MHETDNAWQCRGTTGVGAKFVPFYLPTFVRALRDRSAEHSGIPWPRRRQGRLHTTYALEHAHELVFTGAGGPQHHVACIQITLLVLRCARLVSSGLAIA